jgi:serine/threonine-protein kinase RsbW
MSHVMEQQKLQLHFPAEPRVVHDVRRRFEEFVAPLQLQREEVEAIKVALSEACTNAVCHGSPRGVLNCVHITFKADDDRVSIEIVDEGKGFAPQEIALPLYEEWKPSGRGLYLMQALMDEVRFEPTETGTRVVLEKCTRRASSSTVGEAPMEGPGAYLMRALRYPDKT